MRATKLLYEGGPFITTVQALAHDSLSQDYQVLSGDFSRDNNYWCKDSPKRFEGYLMALDQGDRLLNVTPRRSGVSSADSDTFSTFRSTHGAPNSITEARTNLLVWCAFSGSAGDTATVQVIGRDQAEGIEPILLAELDFTADGLGNTEGTPRQLSIAQVVDVTGVDAFYLRLDSISAGNVDIYASERA